MSAAKSVRAYDAVVIGGDADGFTAATKLASSGSKVLLLDEFDAPGGALREIEFVPGYRAMPFAPAADSNLVVFTEDGLLALHLAGGTGSESLIRRSAKDAANWSAFTERMQALAGFLGELYHAPPPRIDADTFGEFLALANLGRKFRGLGRANMAELLRVLPIPIADLLDDEFETPALKGALAAFAVSDLAQGPTAAGTAFTFLHRLVGLLPGASETSGARIRTYEASARAAGVIIESNRKIRSVAVHDGRATGVVLESGEEIVCGTVISSLDPGRSLLELVDPKYHDPEFIHAVRNIRYRGVTTKVLLALDALPTLQSGEPVTAGSILIAPTIRYVERAYEATKYGRCSDQPFIEIRFPSMAQPDLAPAGRHVAILSVQYTPYRLREASWEALRGSLADRAIAQVDEHLPGFAARVRDRRVLAPPDLESQFGMREGAVSQGEMALDQILFMRPVPTASRYATPIEGLFLCGAGTHPGVGMPGISGGLAARAARTRRR